MELSRIEVDGETKDLREGRREKRGWKEEERQGGRESVCLHLS